MTKKQLNIEKKILDEIFKPYYDLYKELEKEFGKDIANEITNATMQYDFRGLWGGPMIM